MEFFRKIFTISNSAPENIKLQFMELFPNAKGVEWFKQKNGYEAVFNEDNREKISFFSFEGTLMELRTNIALDSIPNKIIDSAKKEGEIMNCISVFKPEMLDYELIVCDSSHKRFRICSNNNGVITGKIEL